MSVTATPLFAIANPAEGHFPFDRVTVDFIVDGGARIAWEINRHFVDDGPYTFTVQVGHTTLDDSDDWEDIGGSVVDTYYDIDTSKRIFGKTLDVHYRVKLVSGEGSYTSAAVNCYGHLDKRDWLLAKELFRLENLRHQKFTSPSGFLIKARRYGPICEECTDVLTEEVSKTNCADCYGTGFLNGYFTPLSAQYADVSNDSGREHLDNQGLGTVTQHNIRGRFLGITQIYSYDVWVNADSDERYYMHEIKTEAQLRGVPIVYSAELRLAPYSDIIYTLPIEEMLTNPGALWSHKSKVNTCQKPVPKPKKQDLNYLAVELEDKRRRRRKANSRTR